MSEWFVLALMSPCHLNLMYTTAMRFTVVIFRDTINPPVTYFARCKDTCAHVCVCACVHT